MKAKQIPERNHNLNWNAKNTFEGVFFDFFFDFLNYHDKITLK